MLKQGTHSTASQRDGTHSPVLRWPPSPLMWLLLPSSAAATAYGQRRSHGCCQACVSSDGAWPVANVPRMCCQQPRVPPCRCRLCQHLLQDAAQGCMEGCLARLHACWPAAAGCAGQLALLRLKFCECCPHVSVEGSVCCCIVCWCCCSCVQCAGQRVCLRGWGAGGGGVLCA